MRRLYNIAYSIWLWLRAPLGLLELGEEGRRREVFSQRMGRFRPRVKQALTNRQMLWLHASSPEAVNLCARFIATLEPRAPLFKLVVSTSHVKGMARLQRLLPNHIERIYLPFDLRRAVHRSLNVVHPEAMVLLEPLLRPNLLWRLRQRRIPVMLLTGRFTAATERRSRMLRAGFRPLYRTVAAALAPDAETAQRLRELGCREEVTRTIGAWSDTAIQLTERRPLDAKDILHRVGFPSDAVLLLGAGTHPGEEQMLGEALVRLRAKHPNLRLVLVPHRYQRGKEVGQVLKKLGIKYVYRTAVTAVTRIAPGTLDCLLVNARGETGAFGEHARVVYAGRSINPAATQSIESGAGTHSVQAAAWGKPLVLGPTTDAADVLVEALVRNGAAVRVEDVDGLERVLHEILSDASVRQRMGEIARRTAESHVGPMGLAVQVLLDLVQEGAARG